MRGDRPGDVERGLRYFRFLVAGNALSSYGTYLNLIALNLFALSVTGSPAQTGLIMAVRLAAGFLTGFVSGSLVSRYNRKVVMIRADLAQAAAMTVLLCAPSGTRFVLVLLYAVALVAGMAGTVSQVALRTSVPEIVGQERRVQANGLLAGGRAVAMVLGFASAGVVVSAFGFRTALFIDALTFLASAVNLAWLPIRTGRATGGRVPEAIGRISPLIGWRLLQLTPILPALIAIRSIDAFGSASHNVGLPVYSSALDPREPAAFVSTFLAIWAVGNIVMQRLLVRQARRTGRAIGEQAFALGTCVMSAAFILAFCGLPAAFGMAVALVAGMADGFTENAYASRLQAVPDERRGYVFGFSSMAESLGFGSGMLISAVLLERHSPLSVVGISHGFAICCGAAFLAYSLVRRAGWTASPAEISRKATNVPEESW